MNPTQTGFYSVIQYCPDRSRMEAANIGVLLFVEATGFLEARFSSDNDRVRRFFGKDGRIDVAALAAAKEMMARRLEAEANELREKPLLDAALRRFANEIVFTPLRPVRVECAEAELAQLFDELVSTRAGAHPSPNREILPSVHKRLARPDVANKLIRHVPVTVPILEDEWIADYAFQNGCLNLIRIQDFRQKKEEGVIRAACQTAAEGGLLYKHPDPQQGQRKLLVIARFQGEARSHQDRITLLMQEHQVELFPADQLETLTEKIRNEAHPLAGQREGRGPR